MKARIRLVGCLAKLSEYSDSSLILRAFTRELGSLSIIAKGIRKTQSRNQLCPLNEYEFSVYEPREQGLYLLAEACPVKERDLSGRPEVWAAAECGLELYASLIIPVEESGEYYRLLTSYLDYLAGLESNAVLIWWRFLLRTFALLGIHFHPDLCSVCGEVAVAAATARGSAELACEACLSGQRDRDRWDPLGEQSARILALLPQIGNHVAGLRPKRESVRELNRLFEAYYSDHFGRELKLRSLKVLEQFY